MKILLLEDNQTLNDTIKLKLKLKGYEVCSFTNGQDAMNAINDGFVCFILDINVPNINGIRILEKIREYYDLAPILIISSTVELEVIKKSYDLGCNDYLKKPFFIDELEIKVDRLCGIPKDQIFFDKHNIFDFSKSILIIDGKKTNLTQKENLMMNLFLKNKNILVSYDMIQNYVWEGEYSSKDAMRALILRLKKKLLYPYIQVSSNRGYIFK